MDAGARLLPCPARTRALLAEALQAARDDGHPKGPLVVGSLRRRDGFGSSALSAFLRFARPEMVQAAA